MRIPGALPTEHGTTSGELLGVGVIEHPPISGLGLTPQARNDQWAHPGMISVLVVGTVGV